MARRDTRVQLVDWLSAAGGIGHLFGRDDDGLTSYALDVVGYAQRGRRKVMWLSTAVPATEWLMKEKNVWPDVRKEVWSVPEAVFQIDLALRKDFSFVVWEKPSAAGPLEVLNGDLLLKSSSAKLSREFGDLLPLVRRRLQRRRASLMIVSRATRRPFEKVYQPSFGGAIKRAGAPFMTVYLKARRNMDRVPQSESEAAALRDGLVNFQPGLHRLNPFEMRNGVAE